MRKFYLLLVALLALVGSAQAQPPGGPVAPKTDMVGFGLDAVPSDFGETYTYRQVLSCDDTGSGTLRAHLQYVVDYRAYEATYELSPPHGFVIWYSEACDTTLASTLPEVQGALVIDGKGTILRGRGFVVTRDNVLLQDFRLYDSAFDGVSVIGAHNVNIQHVTVRGATDGSIDITNGARNVTVQDSMLASPVHTPTRNSTNMLIADLNACGSPNEVKRISLVRNLFVNARARNPFIQRSNCSGIEATDTTAEMVNNVVANWSVTSPVSVAGQGTSVLDGAKVNLVKNYYTAPDVPVGNTARQQNAIIVCHPDATTPCAGQDAVGQAYVPVDSNLVGQQPSWGFNAAEATTSTAFDTELDYDSFPSACDAVEGVLENAGAVTGGRNSEETSEVNSVVVAGC